MTEPNGAVEAVARAEKIMCDFYLSPEYDPKAARPADVVKAAIQFVLSSAQPTTALVGWQNERHRVSKIINRTASPALTITADELGKIMQEEWGEICEDAQAHPSDIGREGRKLFYNPRHWTAAIADRLNARLTSPPTMPTPSDQEKPTEWCPRIGEEVRVSEGTATRWPDWRDVRLWVVGVSLDRNVVGSPTRGLNISVSDEWPVTNRTGGFTDGFYINRDHAPDDLVPLVCPERSPK